MRLRISTATLLQAGASLWIGAATQALGMGQGLVSQGMALHQQEQMYRQQQQAQSTPQAMPTCPTGFKHTVVIHADGTRTVECAEEANHRD
jgi:membrane protease subunit (stomatin/prohibitin family)